MKNALRGLALTGALTLIWALLSLIGVEVPGSPVSADEDHAPPSATRPLIDLRGPYPVDEVVDGDTIRVLVNNESTPVRLIGVDTPETRHPNRPVECFGHQASEHARAWLGDQQVYLEGDPSQDAQDRYGRELAYLWVETDDGTFQMLNEDQIAGGYGHEYTYEGRYAHQDAFEAAESRARQQGRGLWQACP